MELLTVGNRKRTGTSQDAAACHEAGRHAGEAPARGGTAAGIATAAF
jgi:hypothetical protein